MPLIITLDFETLWSDDYTLSKMTTESYIRDSRFKAHGVAIKFDDGPTTWFLPAILEVPRVRAALEQSAVLCHHAQFDGLILSYHFGIRPALWLDTLSMARIALPHDRHSLDNLSKIFGLPGKMHQNLADVKGVQFPSWQQMQALGKMSCDDADKTYYIFQQIKDQIPNDEFRVIDMTIRMFTEPVLRLDEPRMRVYHGEVVKAKTDALAELGLTKKDLGSDEIVAAKYRDLGVEPDTKVTAKGNTKFAFAKTDQFMRDMLEDEDEHVAALTAARLGVKSTLNETRCERLLSMNARGPLAVYLRYCGAHPTRWSGGDSLNWQNFPRNEKDGRPGEIRASIMAPPGHKIAVCDLSQVECRVLNWLAGQHDVVAKFANREDPYIGIASKFYGREVYKPQKDDPLRAEMEKMRGTGKQLELSCGYGAAAASIIETAKRGTYGPPVYLTEEEGERAKNLYRSTHRAVVNMWYQTAEMALRVLEERGHMTWGPLEIDDGAIWLPSGLPMPYDAFKRNEHGEVLCLIRGRWRKMWGTKLVQHVCEALARTIISQAMLRIQANGYQPRNTTHDELWVVTPLDDTNVVAYLESELRKTPTWAPGLPLDAEGTEGERYAK
jgi:DNA polymerase